MLRGIGQRAEGVAGLSSEQVRAAVMAEPEKPIEVREFPPPKVEPGGVLLRTLYSEVCGTDVHLYHGRLAGVPYPIIPGHVSVGIVEEVIPLAAGQEVVTPVGQLVRRGDLVTFLDVHETCGRCWTCLVAKAATRCPQRRVYGITYSATEGLLGGWSEKIYLKPGVLIMHLPEGLSPEKFIAGGCGLPTGFHAVERAGIRLGDTVVVQGSGPVGLSACFFTRLAGARQVIVIGTPQPRLEMALSLGADEAVDLHEYPSPEARVDRIRHLTAGRGADVTIEASGAPGAVAEGMRMTRDAGTYVVVGQYTDHGPVEINPHLDINRKHLDIRGCWGTEFTHLYRATDLLTARGHDAPYEKAISRFYSLEECQQALLDVEHLQVIKAVIKPQ
ncbi:MAG TPA: zinc-binding dehydrogenase [Firmicutes bacterium]|nr:zinc-binding dehydrogenase [Bacillota bacterium]